LEAITMYCFNINVDESDLYTVIKFIPSCLYFTWVSYSMIKRLFQYYIWWLELRCITPLISVIAWRAVLLVEETGVPVEYHRPATSHWQTLSHNVCIEYTSQWTGFKLTLVVIGTDCIGSCKSNYHKITTTMAPLALLKKFAIKTNTLKSFHFVTEKNN
jgi:hypothetical protein